MSYARHEIARRIDLFAEQGVTDTAQTILGPLGYTPEELKRGQTLAENWRRLSGSISTNVSEQSGLNGVKHKRKRQVEQEFRRLSILLNGLYPQDMTVKRIFDAPVRIREFNEEQSEQDSTRKAVNASSYSALILNWRSILQRAAKLPGKYREVIARYGWDQQRLNTVTDLVASFESEDAKHLSAQGETLINQREVTKAFKAMKRWFYLAKNMIRHELEMLDPGDQMGLTKKLQVKLPKYVTARFEAENPGSILIEDGTGESEDDSEGGADTGNDEPSAA